MPASSPDDKQPQPIFFTTPELRKILPEVKFTGQQQGEDGFEKTGDTQEESRGGGLASKRQREKRNTRNESIRKKGKQRLTK
jgi:hypothetical protein